MFASYFPTLLVWGLLLVPVAEASGPGAVEPPSSVRRIELAETRAPPPEVHIGPGLSTTVLFDAPIRPDEVVLEGRERFQRVALAEDHLVLVPSSTFRQGERLRLEVRFHDGAAPERAAFMLVVDAAQVERQVELYRQSRPAESYRQEVEELKGGMARLRQELAGLRTSDSPPGANEALLAILAGMDEIWSATLPFERWEGAVPVAVEEAKLLRVSDRWQALLVVLESNGQGGEWTVTAASLQNAQGRTVKVQRPWHQRSVKAAASHGVAILTEDASPLPAGRYTLKLWNEGDGRSMMIEGLNVP